MIILSFQSVES